MADTEALARVLDPIAFTHREDWDRTLGGQYQREGRQHKARKQAERILADPGPLLAALHEAGVLREVYSLARHDPQPDMSGRPRVQHAGESPDRSVMEEVLSPRNSEGRWIERRYVSDWRPADA